MEAQKIISFMLVLFCFHLSTCAPILNGLLKNTTSSDNLETDFQNETFLTPANETANVSGSELSNPLTNQNTSTILNGKSTFKKIVSKIKSWKNNLGGGNKGGSNKGGSNKDGSNKGGRITGIHRPIRPIRTGDNYIVDYIYIGLLGFAILISIFLGCIKGCAEESEVEKSQEEDENNNNEEDKKAKEDVAENKRNGENKDENDNSEKKNKIFYLTETTAL